MAVSRVLILTASFGQGHNAAARNLRQALEATAPGTAVTVSDVFLETYGWFNRLLEQAYLATINHAPSLWQWIFDSLDRTRLIEQHMRLHGRVARRLENLLDTFRPTVVVSTYPGCNHLLDYVYRRRLHRPFRTLTVVTDSLTINSVWYRARSDIFLVANAETAEVLQKAGVPEAKIRVFGFPVPRIFAELPSRRQVPPADGRWSMLYIVNSGRHAAPSIVRSLLARDGFRLSVTVGRDEKLGAEIRAAAGAAGKAVDVYGWTPEMPQLMADHHLVISKAGGATVQETLAARTPMIITQIVPGQEEGNARLILERGAGELAATPEAIADTVESAFANEAAVWRGWLAAVEKLSRPDASDRIAEFVISQG